MWYRPPIRLFRVWFAKGPMTHGIRTSPSANLCKDSSAGCVGRGDNFGYGPPDEASQPRKAVRHVF